MNAIIKLLLFYITVQEKIIMYLMIKLFGKDAVNIESEKPVNKKYRKLQVDDMPIFEQIKKYDYNKLLKDYRDKHGKDLKPVKPRKNSKISFLNPYLVLAALLLVSIFTIILEVEDNFFVKCALLPLVVKTVLLNRLF